MKINNREKNLFKNTIVLAIGQILPRLVAIITLPIITANLTKKDYGIYDLITTIVLLLIPIVTLQIQSAAFRFLIDAKNDKNKKTKIITNIIIFTFSISIIVGIVTFVILYKINIIMRILIVLYLLFDMLNITLSQICRGLSKNKLYSFGSIILSIVNALVIFLFINLSKSKLVVVISSLVLGNLCSIIVLLIGCNVFKYFDFKMKSMKSIKKMISYSWPMIPNNLSNWVLKLSDRLVITFFLGVSSNAVYAVANKIPNLLSSAQSVFVMAWQENACQAVNDEDVVKYYSKVFSKTFKLILSITALLIAFTPIIFTLLIKGDYGEAYYQMPILILGMFFYCMSSFQGGIYIAHKKTKSVGITTMIAALINLVLDLLLVNILGITAGSISTLIAYLFLYIYRMIDILKFQKINYNFKLQSFFLIIIIFMLVICFINNYCLNIMNIIISIILLFVFNKDYLEQIKNKLIKIKK